jgi:hypothetical protein
MGHFSKAVYDDEDGGGPFRWREVGDPVARDGGPRYGGNLEGLKQAIWFVPGSLGTGTDVASTDVFPDEGPHLGPPILTGQELEGLVLTVVSSYWRIMMKG